MEGDPIEVLVAVLLVFEPGLFVAGEGTVGRNSVSLCASE